MVIDLIRANDIDAAKQLFTHLHEPNSTCLGVSRGVPQGRGVGRMDTEDIFNNILESNAIQTGLIENLEDNILFVAGFGKDKLSDMTTNIIKLHLIEYTQQQCKLHGIQLMQNLPSTFYWNRNNRRWEQHYTEMLVIDDRSLLLIPKGICSYSKGYTPERYYNHFVLNFMQNEHLQLNSALVQTRKSGERFVTKKDLKELHEFSKEFLVNFTQRHPDVLRAFRRTTRSSSLTNMEISDINLRDLIAALIDELQNIPAGTNDATRYHRLITGILELIFYPQLINPILEREIHEGRKRIDVTFDNAAESGIFFRLSNNMGLPCSYIMIECKNYSADPANPELDQLSGRFSPNRGRVGILLCRTIDNINLFLNRCKDTYNDDRGLIIPITDEDVITLLQNYNNWNNDFVETFLSNKIRDVAMN